MLKSTHEIAGAGPHGALVDLASVDCCLLHASPKAHGGVFSADEGSDGAVGVQQLAIAQGCFADDPAGAEALRTTGFQCRSSGRIPAVVPPSRHADARKCLKDRTDRSGGQRLHRADPLDKAGGPGDHSVLRHPANRATAARAFGIGSLLTSLLVFGSTKPAFVDSSKLIKREGGKFAFRRDFSLSSP